MSMLAPARRTVRTQCLIQRFSDLLFASHNSTRVCLPQYTPSTLDQHARRASRQVVPRKTNKSGGRGSSYKHIKLRVHNANPSHESTASLLASSKPLPELMTIYQGASTSAKKQFSSSEVDSLMFAVVKAVKAEVHSTTWKQTVPEISSYVTLAKSVSTDIRNGNIVQAQLASLSVLRVFYFAGNFDLANEWWRWLREQDAESGTVSKAAYALAIRLGTAQGVELAELEKLYVEGLRRFPANFEEYHLSPNAIVPDRERTLGVWEEYQLGHEMTRARLHHRDIVGAYLALDALFRVAPASCHTSVLLEFVKQRPLSEAVPLHAMSCRGGQPTGPSYLRGLLGRVSANASHSSGPYGYVLAARQVLCIVYLQIAAGTGRFAPDEWLDRLIVAISQSLQLKGIWHVPAERLAPLVGLVLECIHTAIAAFEPMRCTPGAASFHAIIQNVAGFGRSTDVISRALADASKLNLAPTVVTMRSILSAAGRIGDAALVRESWQGIVELKRSQDIPLAAADFNLLVKACRLSGAPDYAKSQLVQAKTDLSAEDLEGIEKHMSDPGPDPAREELEADMDVLEELLKKLQADLEVFQQKLQGYKRRLNLKDQRLPMTYGIPSADKLIPDVDLRRIYDEMTTDPSQQPSNDNERPVARSTTDIAFGELRFENWKIINFLLMRAAETEAQSDGTQEAASTSRLDKSTQGEPNDAVDQLDEATTYGLSEIPPMYAEEQASDPEKVERLRQEIFRIRRWTPTQQGDEAAR